MPEPEGGAHQDPAHASQLLQHAIFRALVDVQSVPLRKTIKARYQKFRRMGHHSRWFNVAVSREIGLLQEQWQRIRGYWPGHHPEPTAEAPHV